MWFWVFGFLRVECVWVERNLGFQKSQVSRHVGNRQKLPLPWLVRSIRRMNVRKRLRYTSCQQKFLMLYLLAFWWKFSEKLKNLFCRISLSSIPVKVFFGNFRSLILFYPCMTFIEVIELLNVLNCFLKTAMMSVFLKC